MKTTVGKNEPVHWNSNFVKAKSFASQNSSAADDSKIESDRSLGNILLTAFCLNSVGIVLALLLEAIFSNLTALQTAGNFIDSFFYANYIGTLFVFAVLKITPRLNRLNFLLRWTLLVGTILGLTWAGSLMAGLTLMRIGAFPPDDYGWLTLRRMGLGILLAQVFGISLYFYETVRLKLKATTERLRAKEFEEELARKLALEAALSSLESRIHPHFLFNTLNSISSLVQEDPPLAERMIERLAALLRFSLDSNLQKTIPLEQELKIAVDYLEIEKARFGERLRYAADLPAELKQIAVPPFVAQTLVENSVKHSVSKQKKGGEILVAARLFEDKIQIEVWDDGAGFTPDDIPIGRGLDNLRSRLAALFGSAAGLEILRANHYTIVRVSLPKSQITEGKTR